MTSAVLDSSVVGLGVMTLQAQVRRQYNLWSRLDYALNPRDFSLPEVGHDTRHLLLIPKGLTVDSLLDELWLKYLIRVESSVLNEKTIDPEFSVRNNSNHGYAIFANSNLEADVDYANVSADVLSQGCVRGMTLIERLVFEAVTFLGNCNHALDTEGTLTLCSGDRFSDGTVPTVCCRPIARKSARNPDPCPDEAYSKGRKPGPETKLGIVIGSVSPHERFEHIRTREVFTCK
ncbi:hypothetical protein KC926_01195 [Candidatus Kaiserbacteria bacterium]|nr:hypothetical protein [Candidatus Kaiserbacteria bacterium]